MAYADLDALDPLFDESRFLTGRRPDVDAAATFSPELHSERRPSTPRTTTSGATAETAPVATSSAAFLMAVRERLRQGSND